MRNGRRWSLVVGLAITLIVGPGPARARGQARDGDGTPRARAAASRTLGEVVRESIFGEASREDWRPLDLATFFSEGWREPFVNAPEGENGAPKQPWLLTGVGHFARSTTVDFFYTNGMTDNVGLLLNATSWSPVKPTATGAEYNAALSLSLPLSRRFELQVVAPFIAANARGAAPGWAGNFGDLTVSSRFQLVDHRNFSLLANLSNRIPTGDSINGNGVSFISPSAECWWNFGPKWVLRGRTGINVLTSDRHATDVYFNKLSIGRYLTGKDAAVFKQLVVFGTAAVLTDVRGSKGFMSNVYLTPGVRFGLDRDQKWFVQAAVQVPVSGPQPYAFQPVFSLVRTF